MDERNSVLPVHFVVALMVVVGCAASEKPARNTGSQPAQLHSTHAAPHLEERVRDDFFRGFDGDSAALDRGMTVCEGVLAHKPDDAEALVWHGAGLVFRSAPRFERGDIQGGLALWNKGLAEMNRAVSLSPSEIGVRVPRGSVLLAVYRFDPEPASQQELLRAGIEDYQVSLRAHDSRQDVLSVHARGELLMGLGEGFHHLGDAGQASEHFKRVIQELPRTPYAESASRWLSAKQPATDLASGTCQGCHGARP